MNTRTYNVLYFLLGIFSVMVNWYYNHSIIDAILTWLFWPFYLIYAILVGHLSHGQAAIIFNSYF